MAAAQFAILFDQGPSSEWRTHLILDPAVRPSGGTRSQKLPTFRNTTQNGAATAISGATDATPVVLTTSSAHGLSVDDYVYVTGVGGTVGANGNFRVSAVGSSTTCTLEDSVGGGAYTSGGYIRKIVGQANLLEVAQMAIAALENERSVGN